ncbi:MAG: helicase [Conexibacter sp.]|nr:helicase [Conexibacter sp.]
MLSTNEPQHAPRLQSERLLTTYLWDSFFTKADEEWQLEDLARLVVKGSGVLGWEQGGGKSLGGATLINAQWERGAARRALIVCPQDLVPQWTAEIAKFYGAEPVHITSPVQARQVARELRAGGEGLYITHYEVLSLIGRVDEALPVAELHFPFAQRAGQLLPTTEAFCPSCRSHIHDGWQPRSPHVCEACGYVHKRRKVKTAGHYLAQAFADGVIVVDEGTLAKGNDSLRSKAIRGLRARHRYLLTGTPVSNYVNDVFWLLWWCLACQRPRATPCLAPPTSNSTRRRSPRSQHGSPRNPTPPTHHVGAVVAGALCCATRTGAG